MKFVATSLSVLLLATTADAQELAPLSLAPGEAVTFRFDDGGRVGPPQRSAATWQRLDLVAARQLAGMAPIDVPQTEAMPMNGPADLQPDPIPPDEIRMRMLSIDGRHTLLVIENGQGRALAYRANMTVRGRGQHTDVCVVLPHLPSYEHWAFAIERLELSDFRFIPWAPGRRPTCE